MVEAGEINVFSFSFFFYIALHWWYKQPHIVLLLDCTHNVSKLFKVTVLPLVPWCGPTASLGLNEQMQESEAVNSTESKANCCQNYHKISSKPGTILFWAVWPAAGAFLNTWRGVLLRALLKDTSSVVSEGGENVTHPVHIQSQQVRELKVSQSLSLLLPKDIL